MGFKCELFVNDVDKNLICSICHEVFEDPVSCKSGHTFCDACIQQWLLHSNRCPIDNMLIYGGRSLSRNIALKGVIDNLDVRCNPSIPNGEPRCDWRGSLEKLVSHRKKCLFQEVQCPHLNCNQKIQKREVENHVKICGFRQVECKECTLVLLQQELEKHMEDDCPDAMIPCPNKCTDAQGDEENFKRKDLKDHVEKACSKTKVSCPFETQGCPACVKREDVDKHVQDNVAVHMKLLAKQSTSLFEICVSLKSENVKLLQQNIQLKEDLETIKNKVNSYVWTIDNYPSQLTRHSKGSYFRSPNFWLGGYLWYLRVYPKGDDDSDGLLTLKLCMSNEGGSRTLMAPPVISSAEVAVSYSLSVISQNLGEDFISRRKVIFSKSESLIHKEIISTVTEENLSTFLDDGNQSLKIKCTIIVC